MKHRLCSMLVFVVLLTLCKGGVVFAQAAHPVKIALPPWESSVASGNVLKAALEDKGYAVELRRMPIAELWPALAAGDVDAMLSAWLPATHAQELKKYGDAIEDLGPHVGGVRLGWITPSYVTINSMEQLPAHAEQFNRVVIGVDPGAGLMQLSKQALEAYGLEEFTLLAGSGADMTRALERAIAQRKWIVVAGWAPHWMFGKWDLKFLDDPKKVLGREETINTLVRKGLSQDMPEVYAILDKFTWESPEQLQRNMAQNQHQGVDPALTAKRFVQENAAQVSSWAPQKTTTAPEEQP